MPDQQQTPVERALSWLGGVLGSLNTTPFAGEVTPSVRGQDIELPSHVPRMGPAPKRSLVDMVSDPTQELRGYLRRVTGNDDTAFVPTDLLALLSMNFADPASAAPAHGASLAAAPLARTESFGAKVAEEFPRVAEQLRVETPLTAYHGTPHEWEGGKFELGRIGSGEGAAAYGHGGYFAEVPDTARTYREGLLHGDPVLKVGGRHLQEVYDRVEAQATKTAMPAAQAHYDKLALLEDLMHAGDLQAIEARIAEGGYLPETRAWFAKEIAPQFSREGRLYQVNIHARPEQLLDFEKPLSAQSDLVRQALDALRYPPGVRAKVDAFLETLPEAARPLARQMIEGPSTARASSPFADENWKQLEALGALSQDVPTVRHPHTDIRGPVAWSAVHPDPAYYHVDTRTGEWDPTPFATREAADAAAQIPDPGRMPESAIHDLARQRVDITGAGDLSRLGLRTPLMGGGTLVRAESGGYPWRLEMGGKSFGLDHEAAQRLLGEQGTGASIYNALAEALSQPDVHPDFGPLDWGEGQVAASNALREQGVVGHRYPDQGSRGVSQPRFVVTNYAADGHSINSFEFPSQAEADAFVTSREYRNQAKQFGYDAHEITHIPAQPGTHNYVIYDPRIIEVAKKYGIALPFAAALYELARPQASHAQEH